MLLSEKVEIKWNPKNKRKLEEYGYTYTKMGECVEISVSHLSSGSHVNVEVKCDICGQKFTREWCSYIRLQSLSLGEIDCCDSPNCIREKASRAIEQKYGVSNVAFLPWVTEKREQTNLRKYGSLNPFSATEIKEKIIKTNIDKYGVPHPMMLDEYKDKAAKTCLERYGVQCYLQKDFSGENISGELNPNWSPNKSKEEREAERRLPKYRVWRKDVFVRDGYHCVLCGSKGGRHGAKCRANGLNAHHIYNYSSHEDLRYDINNGVTLCNECHTAFHVRYGYNDNNREQLDEFLNHGKKVC